jgi:CheY-like chemotaxis protein
MNYTDSRVPVDLIGRQAGIILKQDSCGTFGKENCSLPSKSTRTPRARQGETVLVVEDDPDVRAYAVEMVRDLGYQVISAADGRAALRTLDAHPELRLLFTDVGLPGGMNGRQLGDEAVRRRPGIKVLFTTGYARNAIVHHGRLDPGVQVIFKPFTYSDLAARLRKAFES